MLSMCMKRHQRKPREKYFYHFPFLGKLHEFLKIQNEIL